MKKYSILLVVLGAMLWGTDSLFRRPLSRDLSPITIVTLEHLILAGVLLPLLISRRGDLARLNRRDWIALAFIAIGGSVAATSLFTFSIKYGNPSVTVLLQKTQPFFTFLLARWLLHEHSGRWFWICLTPALVGAYLLSAPDWRSAFAVRLIHPANILAALGAAALWGCSTVFGRYIVARIPVLVLTGLRFVIALPVLAVLYWLQPAAQQAIPRMPAEIASVVAMALLPGLAALIFYYHGLQSTIATHASIGELAFPFTAVLSNWILLDIALAESQMIGGAILVVSVTVLTYFNARDSYRASPVSPDLLRT